MPKKLRVLMLDESEVVSSSVIQRLEQGGFEVLCRRAGGMPQWQAALANADRKSVV